MPKRWTATNNGRCGSRIQPSGSFVISSCVLVKLPNWGPCRAETAAGRLLCWRAPKTFRVGVKGVGRFTGLEGMVGSICMREARHCRVCGHILSPRIVCMLRGVSCWTSCRQSCRSDTHLGSCLGLHQRSESANLMPLACRYHH